MKAKAAKCNACDHNALEFSPILKAWVFSCNMGKCEYEPKKNDKLKVIPRDREREKYIQETRG